MRNLLLLLFLFQYLLSNSQEIGVSYKFIGPVFNQDETIQYKTNHKVKVIEVDTVNEIVKFIYYKFNKNDSATNLINEKYYSIKNPEVEELFNFKNINNNDNEALNTQIIHLLSIKKFNNYTRKYNYYQRFRSVRAGFFTVPFKLRLNDFDFEQNVNLGMNIGFQFRISKKFDDKWLLEPTLGIGLATVSLNPENSNLIGEDNRTASAFSISGGLVIHFTNNINLGLQYGWDHLGNNDREVNWIFDRKPWLGIGINIGFSISETKQSEPTN